jgi:DNA-binding protein YbaB
MKEFKSLTDGKADDVVANLQKAQESLAAITRLMDERREIEHQSTDKENLIAVTVDGLGELKSVRVTPVGMRKLDHTAMGELVIEVLQQAKTEAAMELQAEITRTTGDPISDPKDIRLPDIAPGSLYEPLT